MKKIILSIALLIAVGLSAKAQFILGIKGGVNFSKINTDNLKESTLTGYQAGVFARAGGSVFLQPEVYVSSTGGKFDFQTTGTTVTEQGKVRFTNLNVPLLVGGRFGPKNLNFRVMAGPVFTAILNTDENFSTNVTNAYHDFGDYKSSTLGYQVGAGVDLSAFTVDLRYEGGLTKVNSNFGQRQNLWALSVGIKIL